MMKAAGGILMPQLTPLNPTLFMQRELTNSMHLSLIYLKECSLGFITNFSIKADGGAVSKESFFHQFLATREMDPLDMLCQNPNSVFGKFCTSKYLVVVHPKLEASFFGNLDQRNYKKKGEGIQERPSTRPS